MLRVLLAKCTSILSVANMVMELQANNTKKKALTNKGELFYRQKGRASQVLVVSAH